ncbi:MAG: xanthine dehydrogenase family protein subunit M [Thaumarchaeota archaeon]|nr:xanthine dehydrogenase family protein subunit M [Nitrososphaerota archaeon]
MMNKPFDYFAPKSISEAVSLLKKHGSGAKLIAGGQSLVPLMNLGLAAPRQIIDLTHIKKDSLSYVKLDKDSLMIGSMTTHSAVENSPQIRRHCRILSETAMTIADVQVRNRGTIGGSVCHADPAGDYLAPLVAVDAEFRAINPKRKVRTISADKFFVDIFTTALKRDELLTEIRVPKRPSTRNGSAYVKHKYVEGGFAIVGAAAVVSVNKDGICDRAKVVLSGVSTRPVRVDMIEKEFRGENLDERAIEEAGRIVREAVHDPLSDIHASADYRREMAVVFAKRALRSALARSRKTGAQHN